VNVALNIAGIFQSQVKLLINFFAYFSTSFVFDVAMERYRALATPFKKQYTPTVDPWGRGGANCAPEAGFGKLPVAPPIVP
jgi:hypothetical protein